MHPFLIDLDKVSYTPEGTSVLCDVTLQASERRIGIVGR
ncbi:MAG TPA: cobalt ABC transporter, partial [Sulfitobacter pontiacus]|nr:cobalt ABC transporter [Sulfitobacter pontiacus]